MNKHIVVLMGQRNPELVMKQEEAELGMKAEKTFVIQHLRTKDYKLNVKT